MSNLKETVYVEIGTKPSAPVGTVMNTLLSMRIKQRGDDISV
jgi:hypothetical protein